MPSRMNLMLSYALLVFIWATTPLAIVSSGICGCGGDFVWPIPLFL